MGERVAMPGDIADHLTVFVKHGEAAGLVQACRACRGARESWAELIERAFAAGEQREILRLLRPQNDVHVPKSYQPWRAPDRSPWSSATSGEPPARPDRICGDEAG
jgi:hypothetical protein